MKKKKAIRNYVLLSLFIVVTLLLTVISFPVPGTNYKFLGLANMHLGLDLGGGVRNTYYLEVADWYEGSEESAYRKAVDRVQYLLDLDYADARVYLNDNESMTIEVPDTVISSNYILGFIEMKSTSGAEAEAKITGKDIAKVEYKLDGTTHGVYIEFTDDGTDEDGASKYEALTNEVVASSEQTLYIYMNKDYENPFSQPKISETNSYGYVFISGSGITDKKSGERYARLIESTMLGVNMSTSPVVVDTEEDHTHDHEHDHEHDHNHSTQSPIEIRGYFGEHTRLVIIIVTVVLVLASVGLAYLLFKQLGLVSCLSVVFALMFSVLVAGVCDLQVTFAGWVGFLVGYVLNFVLHMYYLNVIKKEYAKGKKFTISFTSGYKKALFNILDILLITTGTLMLFLIVPSSGLKMFTYNMLMTIPATAFTSMLLNKIVAVNYTAFNYRNEKKVNFKREELVDEITE